MYILAPRKSFDILALYKSDYYYYYYYIGHVRLSVCLYVCPRPHFRVTARTRI